MKVCSLTVLFSDLIRVRRFSIEAKSPSVAEASIAEERVESPSLKEPIFGADLNIFSEIGASSSTSDSMDWFGESEIEVENLSGFLERIRLWLRKWLMRIGNGHLGIWARRVFLLKPLFVGDSSFRCVQNSCASLLRLATMKEYKQFGFCQVLFLLLKVYH